MIPMADHAAKSYVQAHHANATPEHKRDLIFAFGAGVDRGLAEAQEIFTKIYLEELEKGATSGESHA